MQTINRVKDFDIIASKKYESRNEQTERYDMLCPRYIVDQMKMKASITTIYKASDILITYALNEIVDKKGLVINHTYQGYSFQLNNEQLIETKLDKNGVLMDKDSHVYIKLTKENILKLKNIKAYEVKKNHYIITFKDIDGLVEINHSRKKHRVVTALILSAFCDLNQNNKTICL